MNSNDSPQQSRRYPGACRGDVAQRIEALFRQLRQHGLDQYSHIQNLMNVLQATPDNASIFQYLKAAVQAAEQRQLVKPDPFVATAAKAPDQLNGDFVLGRIAQNGYPYGIPLASLNQHVLLLGRTHGGKTTAMKTLVSEVLHRSPATSIWMLERKQEFTEFCSMPGVRSVHLVNANRLRINPLRSPPGIAPLTWVEVLAQLMVGYLDIWLPSANLITDFARQLLQAYGAQTAAATRFPTLRDLLNMISGHKFTAFSRDARYQETVINRFKGLLNTLPGVFDCDPGFDVSRMAHENVLFLIHDIPSIDYQNFLCALLMAYLFYYRVSVVGHQAQLANVFILDEATSLFRRLEDGHYASYMTKMICEARAYGISLVSASHNLSNLSDTLLANAAHVIEVGGLLNTRDAQVFASLKPTTPEQRQRIMGNNEPGHAFVSDPRHPALSEVIITRSMLPPPVPVARMDAMARETADRFGWNQPLPPAPRMAEPVAVAPPTRPPTETAPRPTDNATLLLRHIAGDPFMTMNDRLKALQMKPSTFSDAKNRLVSEGWVVVHKMRNKTGQNRDLFEVTDAGYDHLNLAKPERKGIGGGTHQFLQGRVSQYYRGKGVRVEVEGLAGQKNIDLIITDGPVCTAIEIELYPRQNSHFLDNIRLDLAANRIGRVICLVLDKATQQFVSEKMEAWLPSTGSDPTRVKVDLLCNHMEM